MNCRFRRLLLPLVALPLLVSFSAGQPPNAHTGLPPESHWGESAKEYRIGMEALAKKDYVEAISHLEKAIDLNPQNCMAELNVGEAYAQLYKPDVDDKQNSDLGDLAIRHYRSVADCGTSRMSTVKAAKGLASLYVKMKRFDEAKQVYANSSSFDADDPEPHYWIAVIDWVESSQVRQAQEAKLGMKAGEILAVKNIEVCGKVSDANYSNIEEGINQLNKALELDPRLENAMNYMNLLYRERAEIRCNDPALRAADLKTAGEWLQKMAIAKKANAARGAADTER
jgi:tetratricopeptide (TPR) repeat protein